MRRRRAPRQFEDAGREGARAQRNSPVEPATGSERAMAKAADKRTPDGLPAHGFTTLLASLATLTLNGAAVPAGPDHGSPVLAQPTELQGRALDRLEIDPATFLPGQAGTVTCRPDSTIVLMTRGFAKIRR
ncbi:MAG: hypothetical protein OXH76_05780 [Boseongicola sp.]|nr:hypothetical protein [Boseongicola sp.]